MNPFTFKNNQLFCENVPLQEIAQKHGTPLYVYAQNGFLENYRRIDRAFAAVPHLVLFALKSNSNPKLLRLLAAEGSGADVVSGGELKWALAAGFAPEKIVFAGVGKTDAEIRFAIESGISALNVESWPELKVTAEIAQSVGKKAPVAIRLNPDIDIEGHPYLTTGTSVNKFGIELSQARECYRWAQKNPWLDLVGIHIHVGSMVKKVDPYRKSAETLLNFVREMASEGIRLHHIDIGGGIGVDYHKPLAEHGSPYFFAPEALAEAVVPIVKNSDCQVYLEPGRSISANVGVLLTQVLYTKETKGKHFLVVDASMTELIRPSLYGAYHEILPLEKRSDGTIFGDVVGPVCESGDFLAKDRNLPAAERGDYLAVMTAGAYGYVLASNYNARPRPAEVAVIGDHYQVIREPEKI